MKGSESEGGGFWGSVQSGYAIHKLTTARTDAGLTASVEEIGMVCLEGGKATFSYDERWMVFHHYVNASGPAADADARDLGFAAASDAGYQPFRQQGTANVYLLDLRTGETTRLTRMEPGQYALFPHFRSDGWIYFVVRTLDGEEYFAATDAALLAEGQN